MGTFSNNAITDNGRVLLSHVQMGAVFTPTKVVMGSGNLPAGTTVRSITAVVAPEQILTISKKKRANDGTVTVGGVYSNQAVTTGFYFRELGLYAKAVYPDGREIPEVLYSYGNAGSTADYMTAYTSGQPVEREIDLVVYIGNDTVVDLTIESGVYITREQLEEELQDAIDEVANGVGATIIREIEIPAEGWTPLDTGPYPYQADVPLPEAKEAFFPSVALHTDAIQTANAAGLCQTAQSLAGVLRFWAKKDPAEDMAATIALLSSGSGGSSGGGEAYVLPVATKTQLGGVKIGRGIGVTADGTISSQGTVGQDQIATESDASSLLDEVFRPE